MIEVPVFLDDPEQLTQGFVHALNVSASSDWHIGPTDTEFLSTAQARELIQEMALQSDILVNCGDIIGTTPEDDTRQIITYAERAAYVFRESSKPVLVLPGNHDYHGNHIDLVRKILSESGGVIFLDEAPYILSHNNVEVGFVGVKGFGGGFHPYAMHDFGEPSVRQYIREMRSENEALREYLQELDVHRIFVATHYAPVRDTVLSEHPEVRVSMGNSGLADEMDQFVDRIVVAVHGHAHHGDPYGYTKRGVSVHNVAYMVLRKLRQGDSSEFIPTNLYSQYTIS